jgi:predicted membrane-bound dolichyl-phosphate-mannose-protein mannosyltransferase
MDTVIFELLENHDYEQAINKIIDIIVELSNEYNILTARQREKFPDDENINYYDNNDYIKIDKQIIKLNQQKNFYDKLLKELTNKILE